MTTMLKCKMCGGTLEVQENETVARCRYCGSLMTLPKIDNEKKARLFNRANQYRLDNEFDRAYEAYKAIAAEDIEEPEAYWGMLLSEYGIEYVEDPQTGERKPTCHRTIPTSIKNSSNFKLALQYADAEQKMMYEDEAEVIDEIQRRILSVSSREEPYDVFICYKDTNDLTGERTTDSVLAQDIYNELTKQGMKTFFSRVTLEDKLGVDYEPYIYAALKSARVMLVVTEDPNNCNSVWVKNEWMRFLNFMKEDSSKVIIPVYQKITAYDLPSELSRFQSQDMSKIGAIQDLVHGVQKLIAKEVDSEDQILLRKLIEEKRTAEEKKKKSEEELKQQQRLKEERKKRAIEEEAAKKAIKRAAWQKNKKWVFAGVFFVVACIIASLIFVFVIQPKQKLNKAMALIDSEKYEEAYSLLEEIGKNDIISEDKYNRAIELINRNEYTSAYLLLNGLDYKDSEEQLLRIETLQLQNSEIGSKIYFGSYEQDGYFSNGSEPIEWRILSKEENKCLLLSEYGLASMAYDTENNAKTWERCSLREWLNNDFLTSAFSQSEQNMIQTSTIVPDMNLGESYSSEHITMDKVFLLSIDEAKNYFVSNNDRIVKPTARAISEGASVNENGTSLWWLRSPGQYKKRVACISPFGVIAEGGFFANEEGNVVRPAVWIVIE